MSGPVPKHSSQRRRRNADSKPETLKAAGPVVKAPPLRKGLSPLAVQWYEALKASDQTRFYQPSDWAMAQVTAEAIHDFTKTKSPTLLRVILQSAASLLATEGDRRRLRLELTREAVDEDEEAAVSELDEYRRRLS